MMAQITQPRRPCQPCVECVKEAIYVLGPAFVWVICQTMRRIQRLSFSSVEDDGCCTSLLLKIIPLLISAALIFITGFPILYAFFRSPWLGCIPEIGPLFGTPAHHQHLIPLYLEAWHSGTFGDDFRRSKQHYQRILLRARNTFSFPSIVSAWAHFSRNSEAEAGQMNPTPQWMVSATDGKEGSGWSQEEPATAEEDDWEEDFSEEEECWGDEEGDMCDLSDDSVHFTDEAED